MNIRQHLLKSADFINSTIVVYTVEKSSGLLFIIGRYDISERTDSLCLWMDLLKPFQLQCWNCGVLSLMIHPEVQIELQIVEMIASGGASSSSLILDTGICSNSISNRDIREVKIRGGLKALFFCCFHSILIIRRIFSQKLRFIMLYLTNNA